MFDNATEAIDWIEHIERVGEKRTDLSRMNLALEILGNPEKDLKIIHVAGTNGKGSTASFIKNILIEGGFNVGSFFSPYIISFNERIQYNYGYISDADLVLYTNTVFNVRKIMIDKFNSYLTFFEVVTLIGICYFYAKGVDYAILEVGLGGKLDATNFCNACVSVITNIGYDHMSQLGNTLEEIALNKLGIIKEGNHLITTVDRSLWPLFLNYTLDKKATIQIIDTEDINVYDTEYTSFCYNEVDYDLNMIGIHQAYNAALAIATINYIEPLITDKVIKRGLLNTMWPGRLEIVKTNPKVILDGGHNIHGITALVETIKKNYGHVNIVFACLADKESKKMIDKLKEVAKALIITEIDYHRGLKAQELYDNVDYCNKILEPNFEQALLTGINLNDTLVVTGSLYFISRARAFLKRMK